jgi:hypothetical protein
VNIERVVAAIASFSFLSAGPARRRTLVKLIIEMCINMMNIVIIVIIPRAENRGATGLELR